MSDGTTKVEAQEPELIADNSHLCTANACSNGTQPACWQVRLEQSLLSTF